MTRRGHIHKKPTRSENRTFLHVEFKFYQLSICLRVSLDFEVFYAESLWARSIISSFRKVLP
jgi:hypothetical protein